MFRKLVLFVAATLLVGCAATEPPILSIEKGRFADYRAYLEEQVRHTGFTNVPDDVVAKLRPCLVDLGMSAIPPADIPRLDAYARGEQGLSSQELAEMSKRTELRMGDDQQILADARAICPDAIRQLEPYVKSGSKPVYVP